MFKKLKYTSLACASLAVLALSSSLVIAQTTAPPLFPGFPNPAAPGGTSGSSGTVYTPFNPLSNQLNPGGSNLYNPSGFGYNSFGPNYYVPDPVGSYLYGTSAVINSTGQYLMNQEMAQMYRQMALQKQLETIKQKFDLEKYIRENTPSFTDEQTKIAAEILKRVLKNATPWEIWNGNAQNILLKDLKQHDLDRVNLKTLTLPETTLRQLNVTFGNNGNLGLLRNNGQFNWPLALTDDELVPQETRTAVTTQAENLVAQAANGPINIKTFKDLKKNIDDIREKLTAKVLVIPTGDYMQAKRFLESFDDALRALQEPKVAAAQFEWQKFATGGKTVQQVVDYMKEKGVAFGPSTSGDEAAYETLYSALANYAIAFNTQLVSSPKNNGNGNK